MGNQLNNALQILLLAAPIAACTSRDHAEDSSKSHPDAATVWDSQTRTLERAREADRLVQEAAQKQRQAIEAQSR